LTKGLQDVFEAFDQILQDSDAPSLNPGLAGKVYADWCTDQLIGGLESIPIEAPARKEIDWLLAQNWLRMWTIAAALARRRYAQQAPLSAKSAPKEATAEAVRTLFAKLRSVDRKAQKRMLIGQIRKTLNESGQGRSFRTIERYLKD
jgi:hypothetical protein